MEMCTKSLAYVVRNISKGRVTTDWVEQHNFQEGKGEQPHG